MDFKVNNLVRRARFTMTVFALLAVTGCVTTGTEDVSAEQYNDFDLGPSPLQQAAITKPVVASAPQAKQYKKRLISSQLKQLPSIGKAKIGLLNRAPKFADSSKTISVSINEMTVGEFIHHMYGDLLDLDYAIASEVEQMRTKVVLRLQTPVTQNKLYNLAASLLEENQVMVSSKDNLLYFQPLDSSDKKSKPVGIGARVSDIPNVAGNIIQLIPYTFNSSQTIQRIVTKLTNAVIFPYDDQKLIVADGNYDELVRVVQLVNTLDVPSAKGRDIRYLSMVYISANEMIDLLGKILSKEGFRVGDNGDIAFVAIPRQNSVITYSTSALLGDRVVSWARKLDKPEESEKSKFYIFRPMYSKAEDLHTSVKGLIGNDGVSSLPATSGSANANAKAKAGENASSVSRSGSIIRSGKLKISVDKIQNSLLIQATPMQYRELLVLLDQLDKLPPQIALDVAIAEFDISDNFSAGISKILFDSSANNTRKGIVEIKPSSGSFNFSGILDSLTVDFSLLSEKSKSRVLSRPYLVVQDGKSATISAGKQVPVQTGTTTTDGGTTTTEIQYRNTGVNLTVTPTINADGLVALEISQSVSNTEPGPSDLSPIITNRSLSTSVLVGNGQTAILGGLIQNNDTKKGNSVPFLSDLPLIGQLFKAKADTFSRTELVIMITPKILRNSHDLDDFSDSMKGIFTLPLGEEPSLVLSP